MYNKNNVFIIRSSQPALIKQEFLAFLNVLLSNKEIIKFSELMPKETYTSEDAATAFEILLGKYYSYCLKK